MSLEPQVDVIIPHYNGKQILTNCLASLEQSTYKNIKVWVVDNGSTDDSAEYVKKKFKWINIISPGLNLGYAGGCNYGYEKTQGKYVIFLNNDTEHEPDWIAHLVFFAEENDEVAAIQPKVLSIQGRNEGKKVFDYAGAAGGLMDHFGYPYAYGRMMNHVEDDVGQYDNPRQIFWASGTAMFLRRDTVEKVGVFDEDFFAHMEEIDLCWRLQIAGYKIYSQPRSVVYHYGGATLRSGSEKKIYLNHRNNIFMILKNMEMVKLILVFPVRVLLDLIACVYYLMKFNADYFKIPLNAMAWNLKHLQAIMKKRKIIQSCRKVSDKDIFLNSRFLVLFNRC